MSNTEITSDPGPEPADNLARMRERLLAYHCGALEEDEAALVRGRLESDPDWQRASAEAKKMLSGLETDGVDDGSVPVGLGERALQRLKDEKAAAFRSAGVPPASHSGNERLAPRPKPNDAPVPAFFSLRAAAAIFALCALPVVWMTLRYATFSPPSESIRWQPDASIAAGGPFGANVVVRDSSSQQPRSGVRLAAFLQPASGGVSLPIGEGETGAAGVVEGAAWKVPDVAAGEYKLTIEARSRSGNVLDHAEHNVKVTRAERLALSPDRTQARPGEKIRARALLVSEGDEKPVAGKPVTLDLMDPRGNRIARAEVTSSKYGLAWAEFPLDSAAPEGNYTLKAEASGLNAERIVEVKQYTLPPFRVTVAPDQKWFALRDRITGKIRAETFDGHVLANAKGEVQLLDTSGKVLRRANLACNAQGIAEFDLDEIGGAGGELAQARINVKLADAAGRSATGKATIGVGVSPVKIDVLAEAGELVPGVENRVYIVVRGADGAPVKTQVNVTRDLREPAASAENSTPLKTDANGVAVYSISDPKAPAEVLQITPDYKNSPPQNLSVPVRSREKGALLVRTDRAVLKGGEKLKVSLLAGHRDELSSSPNVILALRKDGRTIATGGALLRDGKGETELTIPAGITGAISVEATLPGAGWSDARMVLVSSSARVRVVASADRQSYRPGDRAHLKFSVTDAGGSGIPAAVSVVGVDDALLAMTGEHPGLAQALQMAGANVLGRPDLALDPQQFSANEGSQDAALAAMAAARPKTPEAAKAKLQALLDANLIDKSFVERMNRWVINPTTDEDRKIRDSVIADMKEDGMWSYMEPLLGTYFGTGQNLIDTAPEKLARHQQEQRQRSEQIQQGLAALLPVGLILLLVLYGCSAGGTAREACRAAEAMVPAVTATAGILGLFLCANFRRQEPAILLCIISVSTILAHIVLLWRAEKLKPWNAGFGQSILTGFADFVLLCLVASLIFGDWEEPKFILLVLGVFTTALLQQVTRSVRNERTDAVGVFFRVAGVVAFMFVVASISIPSLLRSRMAANATAGAAMMKAFAEANEIYKRNSPSKSESASIGTPGVSSATHLRWDFPETMIFAPQIVTDEDGRASFDLTVADSLTSWRVQADAIAAAGGTAWTDARVVVTQPFSVDLTLPADVTVGDVLHVPAVVTNYSEAERVVDLTLNTSGAELLDNPARKMTLGPKSVASVEFAVRFDKPGQAILTCNGLSGGTQRETDAVQRSLTVLPDGAPVSFATSALISTDGELAIQVPDDSLPGTIHSELRLHRGPLTQMIEGLESMLQEPHGCFEQTSSSTYPNIMILRYLKANNATKPEIEARAKDYIARGYQRLLGFEVSAPSGSFSLYGQAPASTFLTAYGLMEFSDMNAVWPVDPALLERTRGWLKSRMNSDGSFNIDSYQVHERSPQGLAGTAYVVLALGKDAPNASVDFLRRNRAELEKSAYLCALAANALLPHDRATAAQLAGKLHSLAQITEAASGAPKKAVLSTQSTLAWGYGDSAAVEASALGVLALLESGTDLELAQQLLAGIQAQAGNRFGFGSTHATVLALKALERASGSGRKAGPARIIVHVNGKPLAPIELPAEETATPFSAALDLPNGKSRVQIQCDGGPVAARVTGSANVPWRSRPVAAEGLRAAANYDSLSVQRGQSVLGTLQLSSQRGAEVPMVEWGLPAGFVPESEDLDALKAKGTLSRWEMSGRSLRLYVPDLAVGKSSTVAVRFYPTAKGELKTRAGRAYEYYRAENSTALEPVTFNVK